ncbi:MAG: methyltransferase domain-containing protein [Planctomycetota bacterium]|nr:methyltransferase domain-containing protein [Planctomycetota bacterium]
MARHRKAFAIATGALALTALLLLSAPPSIAEDPEQDKESESILKLIRPRPGETIADVGCGKGTWTFPLGRAVGPHGRIYAVDIDRAKVDTVRKRVEREQVTNVTVIHSVPDDPMLPKDSLDAVFLNDVIDYVERSALAGFLDGIRVALKRNGRLILRDPKGNPSRVISECYRAGFNLVEAKIPLGDVPQSSFSSSWYALKLRRAEQMQPAILPRLGEPRRYRTRLHLAEELFRAGLLSREELRTTWESIVNAPGEFDPKTDEPEDLIRAAQAAGVLSAERAGALRKRVAAKSD